VKTRTVVAIVLVCGFFFACRAARAAGNDAEEKVTALNRAAVEAYGQGDFKKMKAKLQEALKIAKKDLDGQPMLARTYLHMGVLYVDGLDNREAGVKAFAAALKLNPSIQITAGMDTKTVNDAFAEARSESAGGAAPVAKDVGQKPVPEAPTEKASPKGAEKAAPAPTVAVKEDDARDEGAEAPARKLSPKEERAAKKEEARSAKLLEAEKKRNAAEQEKLTKQLAQAQKDLADARLAAAAERAEKERLQREMKQLSEEAKKQVADAQAETKRLTKQIGDDAKKQALEADAQAKKQAQELDKERAAKDKQIADGQARENKEREAKEKLQQQLQERDKLLAETKQALAEAKQALQQAEKDKAAKDKEIADGQAREKKEREAKEKLEKEKQAAKEKEAERKAKEDAERAERAKLAAGPAVPDHFSEPVYCDVPEIANPGTDLYVHCVAQPKVKAKEMTFFYRSNGASLYNALVMEKSKKGWFMTMVPGDRISGRSLQYYAEAHGDQRAANGKPGSPNVMALRSK
jgi:hypothetical protein